MPAFLVLTACIGLGLLVSWQVEAFLHARRVDRLQHRIHVNGIRGKSTVTRIVAGMLREAGHTTIAKSTGTFAAVIDTEGNDIPIERNGPATILEQIKVAKEHITPDIDSWVVECMAIRPAYQAASEDRIVRSTIGVLTNVREDHQDVMGETLPEIARSLLTTCPRNGVLVTAEQNPSILAVIRDVASSKGTRVVVADPKEVTQEAIDAFDYIAFPDNIAIGYSIADLLGIDREIAQKGMVNAQAEPGVLRIKEMEIGSKQVTWANLLAVNDRESMVAAMKRLSPYITDETTTVGVLNNRADRERRAIQFSDVAVHDLDFDRLVTFGAFERIVTDRLIANGYPISQIINLGEDRNPTVDEIIERMILKMPSKHVLVVGFVNIHTHQAEMMLDYFEHAGSDEQPATERVSTHA